MGMTRDQLIAHLTLIDHEPMHSRVLGVLGVLVPTESDTCDVFVYWRDGQFLSSTSSTRRHFRTASWGDISTDLLEAIAAWIGLRNDGQ